MQARHRPIGRDGLAGFGAAAQARLWVLALRGNEMGEERCCLARGHQRLTRSGRGYRDKGTAFGLPFGRCLRLSGRRDAGRS